MDTETLAKALAEAARQRKLNGEPLYRCRVGDLYLGHKYRLVKTKGAAMELFTDNMELN